MLQALESTTLRSLAASSRELRELIQTRISVIRATDMADVDLLLNGRWHNLRLVIMQESSLLFLSMLDSRNNFNPPWQLSLCLQSTDQADPAAWDKQDTAMILRPAHLDMADCTQHVMQSVDHLLKYGWPIFRKLWLAHTKSSKVAEFFLDKLYMAAIWLPDIEDPLATSLVELQTLSLHLVPVNVAVMLQVIQKHLPMLNSLTLSNCQLNAEALSIMQRGQWLWLKSLKPDGNTMDAAAVACLVKCNFPELQELQLNHTSLDASGMQHLSKTSWLWVTKLGLANNILDDAAVNYLMTGPWYRLAELDLGGNLLDSQSI